MLIIGIAQPGEGPDLPLPVTSNVVEWGNRRYNKMRKRVFRVRTASDISQRIAMNMLCYAQTEGR